MTTNEDVLLREVDEDLNQEKQLAFLRRYGPWLAGVGVAVVIGVGVLQYMSHAEDRAIARSAERYAAAVEETEQNPIVGAEALAQVSTELDGGYEVLADIRTANLYLAGDEKTKALDKLAEVYDDNGVPVHWRDLARLRAAMVQLETNPSQASLLANDVSTPAFAPYAREVEALAAMAVEDYETAYNRFLALSGDAEVPPSLATRARMVLPVVDAGRKGVALEPTQTEAESFISDFSRQLAAEQAAEAEESEDAETNGSE
ncbi:tetratricopeptide repeat protein [Parvularcula sp. LCG005]|uniref:tetratricopeptide repeat protein n=1 Tax=Parvularcula sp. LCG005 TaxID=3078805 RepID=UPI0029426A4D|nr:tetratricopeptide repeat protein [Parvularcula sp. LCG005]WOI54154.1 tetratricopeptide repeat protein [Parvularcula sp. LCG005]